MRKIYERFIALFMPARKQKPGIDALAQDILAAIEAESRFLRNQHAVEVHALSEGEEAAKPRAVDPAVEASLPFIEGGKANP